MGGGGQGKGGQVPNEYGDAKFKAKRVKGRMDKMHVAGAFLFKGKQVKGEAAEAYGEAVKVSRQKETEAIEKAAIPKGYKRYVRDYFDSITPKRE